MKAIEILEHFKGVEEDNEDTLYSIDCYNEAIAELEALENKSCNNCKNSSFELKFGELEFNACFLVSNGNVCKWESKNETN